MICTREQLLELILRMNYKLIKEESFTELI